MHPKPPSSNGSCRCHRSVLPRHSGSMSRSVECLRQRDNPPARVEPDRTEPDDCGNLDVDDPSSSQITPRLHDSDLLTPTVAEPFLLSRMIGNRGSHRRQVQDGHVPAAILYLCRLCRGLRQAADARSTDRLTAALSRPRTRHLRRERWGETRPHPPHTQVSPTRICLSVREFARLGGHLSSTPIVDRRRVVTLTRSPLSSG